MRDRARRAAGVDIPVKGPQVKTDMEYIGELQAILPAQYMQQLAKMGDAYIQALVTKLRDRDAVACNWAHAQSEMAIQFGEARLQLTAASNAMTNLSKFIEWDPQGGAYIAREIPSELLAQVLVIGEPLLLEQTTKELDGRVDKTEEEFTDKNLSPFDRLEEAATKATSNAALQAKLAIAACGEATRQGFKYGNSAIDFPYEGEVTALIVVEGRPHAKLDRSAFTCAIRRHIPLGMKLTLSVSVEIPCG